VKSVKSHLEGDYGYLRLSAFNEKTGQRSRRSAGHHLAALQEGRPTTSVA